VKISREVWATARAQRPSRRSCQTALMTIMSALELIEPEPVPLDFAGAPIEITTGPARAHAVVDEGTTALCGTAVRRVLPTGWEWESAHPAHIERCASCLRMHPLESPR